MRILIVEDEVRLASTLQDLLELNGYTADICHDGESGLDNALSGIYDMILLDVMLPKRNGFSVLRELRAAGSSVSVLMLTARSDVDDRVQGLDCGADYYLTKPFEPKELLACVRALTRRQPDLRAFPGQDQTAVFAAHVADPDNTQANLFLFVHFFVFV